ncbi:MAG: metal-sensitive transcriptional regulator [bacterium]
MQISEVGFPKEFVKDITLRLKRVEGQTRGLREMILDDRDCEEIMQQLSAASRALDRVSALLLTTGMEVCIRRQLSGEMDNGDVLARIQKMFMRYR